MPAPGIDPFRLASLLRRLRALSMIDMDLVARKAEALVSTLAMMEVIVDKRFHRESTRSVGGQRWAARRSPGDGHPLLNLTGNLRRSATDAVQGTYRLDNRLIRWEVPDFPEYGQFHQEGTARMARRPFMFNPSHAELEPANRVVLNQIKREINSVLRAAR